MIKKLILRLCLMMAVMLSLFSCRNDLLPENNNLQNPNASKFRIVRLKDIPAVESFIHRKTGNTHFSLPFGSSTQILEKNTAEFGAIDTDFIVESIQGEDTYYVFKVSNLDSAHPENIYNFQVKQTGGILQNAEVIAYKPEEGTETDLDHFSGKVQSFDTEGNLISSMDYKNESSNCQDIFDNEGGGNNNDGGGNTDGGITNIPSYPEGTEPPIVLGPQGPEEPSGTPGTDESGCWSIDINAQGGTIGYYNSCTGAYISVDYSAKTLSSGCNSGAGVVMIPMNPVNDHCEKTKNVYNNTAVKSRYEVLQGHTSDAHETGYGFKTVSDGNGGTTTQTNPLEPDTSDPDKMKVGIFPTSYGYVHTHLDKTDGKMAVKIFSPADINTFLAFLHNAQANGMPLGSIFGGMLASDADTGYNIYQLQYTGDGTDLPAEFTKEQVDVLRDWYRNEAQQIVNNTGENLTHSDMQKLFSLMIKKMNLQNVVLSKIEGSATKTFKTVNFDTNGNPTEEICP